MLSYIPILIHIPTSHSLFELFHFDRLSILLDMKDILIFPIGKITI